MLFIHPLDSYAVARSAAVSLAVYISQATPSGKHPHTQLQASLDLTT